MRAISEDVVSLFFCLFKSFISLLFSFVVVVIVGIPFFFVANTS